jgi:hypothetical protein
LLCDFRVFLPTNSDPSGTMFSKATVYGRKVTVSVLHSPSHTHRACRAADVMESVKNEVLHNDVRFVMHVGDVSYADGEGPVWEKFMEGICRFADSVPYMVAVGNHDYDYQGSPKNDPSGLKPLKPKWGQFTPDSLGECGVALAKRFAMPKDRCGRPLPKPVLGLLSRRYSP